MIMTTATSAMTAASRAYSMRSCPSSSRTNRASNFFMTGSLECPAHPVTPVGGRPVPSGARRTAVRSRARPRVLRLVGGVRYLGVDLRVDQVHAGADADDHDHCHERDERGQQGVLDEVLPLILANEPNEQLPHD